MPKSFIFICLLHVPLALFAQNTANNSPVALTDSVISSKLLQLALLYRLDSASLAGYDKIITYDKDVYVVKIHNITFTDVRFTYPFEDELSSVSKVKVSQILYADGRRDVFIPMEDRTVNQKEWVDTNKIIIKNAQDWVKVMVTEDPAVVSGLVEKGDLKASYEADKGNVSNDELMRRVSITLKKKAAALKAHYVLIDTRFFYKAYGDLPKVEITARAFGY
jgi:hypothetical protein